MGTEASTEDCSASIHINRLCEISCRWVLKQANGLVETRSGNNSNFMEQLECKTIINIVCHPKKKANDVLFYVVMIKCNGNCQRTDESTKFKFR